MAHTGNKRRSGGLFARGPGTSWLNSDSSGCASWQRPHRQTPSWWAHPAHHYYPPLSGERGEVAVRSTENPQMVSMCPQGLSDSAHPTGTFIQPMAHILMVQCFYHYLKLDIKCPLSGHWGKNSSLQSMPSSPGSGNKDRRVYQVVRWWEAELYSII